MPTFKDFKLPDLGEGLTEGEILKWLVQPGDEVTLNQPIVEVETAAQIRREGNRPARLESQ